MCAENWFKKNTVNLYGERVALTGATGGLGEAWCRWLLRLNASLILINRNAERAEQLRTKLLMQYPNAEITLLTADMEQIDDVEAVCTKLEKIGFDYLLLNAGAYAIPRHKCPTGYGNVFQINFASPYYMVRRLLPYIKEHQAHTVAVGSIAHNYSKTDADDIDFSSRKAASKVYGNAKRYLMFSLYELAQMEQISLSVTHPGISFTGITDHYPKWLFFFIKHPMKWIFMKPKKASLCLLAGMFEPTDYMEWIGPRFFDVWGLPKKKKLKTCTRAESRLIAERAEAVYAQCIEKKTVL